jgi:TPR repeat protein
MKSTGSKLTACLKFCGKWALRIFLGWFIFMVAVLAVHKVQAEEGNVNSQMWLAKWYDSTVSHQHKAMTFYRLAAEQGHAEAQYTLGYRQLLQYYRRETRDASDAYRWLRMAAAQDHQLAKKEMQSWNVFSLYGEYFRLSKSNDDRLYSGEHHEDKHFKSLHVTGAAMGNVYSQYLLGVWSCESEDWVEAARLLRLAADQAEELSAKYQFKLSVRFWQGDGVVQDKKVAVRLFRLAAEHFNDIAEDKAEAARFYRLAAEEGYTDVMASLAQMYYVGEGVVQHKSEAVRWYRLAAEQGCVTSQFALGLMLHNGDGVAQDKAEAARFYRLAAKQGCEKSMNNLGVLHLYGDGISQDKAEAARLFRSAPEQQTAMFNLGLLFRDGDGVTQDEVETFRLWSKLAEMGNADAQNGLGELMRRGIRQELGNGHGTVKDEAEAIRFYRLAAEQGHEAAAIALNSFLGG